MDINSVKFIDRALLCRDAEFNVEGWWLRKGSNSLFD